MRKVVLGLMGLFGFLFGSQAAAAVGFQDVSSHFWAYEEISYLSGKGVIKGYEDGTFRPNQTVTKEQAMVMVQRVTKKEVAFPVTQQDLRKPLTRGEAALLLKGNFNLQEGAVTVFDDIGQESPYYDAVQALASNQITTRYDDGTFRPDGNVTRAQFSLFLSRVLEPKFRKNVALQQQAKQRIKVKNTSLNVSTVQLQELVGNKWTNVGTPFQALNGKNGIGKTKEGDGKTPVGTYALGTAFGWGPQLPGLNYPFKTITSHDYWVDDVNSTDYNKWVTYAGDPKAKWSSYEKMNHPLYKYGVVVRYNEDPIVKGKGSAIFLHIRNTNTKYTLGCIALAEKDMIKVIQWLKSDSHPIITIQ